jgi:hypothetical protein
MTANCDFPCSDEVRALQKECSAGRAARGLKIDHPRLRRRETGINHPKRSVRGLSILRRRVQDSALGVEPCPSL